MTELIFGFSADENAKYQRWNKDHQCEYRFDSGACGGRLTYTFTPTGIGTVKKVKCACGEEIDLTDYRF